MAQRLRGRPPAHGPLRRRAGRSGRHADAARLHRRRRLPHAQRQGRPGHERVDAGRLEPRLEARPGAVGAEPRAPARDLLGGASGDRAEPHRLRQGVVDAHGEEARGVREPVRARGLLRVDGRVPRGVHDPVPAVDDRRPRHPSVPRHRLPDRQAVQVRPRRAGRRRERRPPRASPPGRRPLARLRLRGRRASGRAVRPRGLGGLDGELARVAPRPVHPAGVGSRQRARR